MADDLIKRLRDAAQEEEFSVEAHQDFYHASLLRQAADALDTLSGGTAVHPRISMSDAASVISRKPSEQEVHDVCWQINRKQSADRVDASLVRDVWAAITYLAHAVPDVTVSYAPVTAAPDQDHRRFTAGHQVVVKPLREDRNVGSHDERGRFCLPLSAGYYIKFPKKEDQVEMYMAWYHDDPVGGSSNYKETIRIAQEHHRRRVLSHIQLDAGGSTNVDDDLVKELNHCAELLDGESNGLGNACREAARRLSSGQTPSSAVVETADNNGASSND